MPVMPRSSVSMSSTTNVSKLADGRAREFFWGITLDKNEPEYIWTFEEEGEDKDFLEHTLFLRHAVIGQMGVQNERNLVVIETKTFHGKKLIQPLFSLTLGKKEMCQLDINFGHETNVTFKLVEGTGPIHISAQQLVEFPIETLDADETEYTGTEDEDLDEVDEIEDSELNKSNGKPKKRKVSLDKGAAKKKKASVKHQDSSEEEEEDEEEVDEEDEESMDDDEEEEDDSEVPESPAKKKVSKSKPKNAKANGKKEKGTPKGKKANAGKQKKVK